MNNIASLEAYVPRLRIDRKAIAAAMGWLTQNDGAAQGARTLAFWDEDSVTMGVAAARLALPAAKRHTITSLQLATTTAPFIEPMNASFVHAALLLRPECLAQDMGGTYRSGLVALHTALESSRTSLVVAADRPLALAGSRAEIRSGDAAAAAVIGPGEGILKYLGGRSVTVPFVDRYRTAEAKFPLDWEERWVRDEGYLRIVPRAIEGALGEADLAAQDIDYFVLACPIAGCAAMIAKSCGLTNALLADPLIDRCGDTGSPHAMLMLAGLLPTVRPGQRILLAQFGQGATALIFEATERLAERVSSFDQQLADGVENSNYLTLAVFKGLLPWDRGLRGRYNLAESLTVSYRHAEAMLGFQASRSSSTGRVFFPPHEGHSSDQDQQLWPLADRSARVATCTADHLAFSRCPPNCYGFVDFEGGGRLMMDFTDPDASDLNVGDPVRFAFRVKDIDENTGFRRYFWKAVREPVPTPSQQVL